MINVSIENQKEEEENEMSILQSFFDSVSQIQLQYQQEKDRVDEQIKITSQTLFSQTTHANSMFSDVLPSMEYPFFYFDFKLVFLIELSNTQLLRGNW